MKHRFIKYLIGSIVFLVIFTVMFICTHILADFLGIFPPALPKYGKSLFASLLLAISAIVAVPIARFAMRCYSRKYNLTSVPLNKWLVAMLLVGYILTAAIGVPTVQSSNTQWALQEHASIEVKDKSKTPYLQTYLALSIFPFVVLSYHEYQLAGLYGRGGWDVHLWYLFGVKSLIFLPIWVS